MKDVAPLYKVPSKKTIKKMIFDIMWGDNPKFKEAFEQAVDVTITTDVWSETMPIKSLLGATIHFLQGTELFTAAIKTEDLFKLAHWAIYCWYIN